MHTKDGAPVAKGDKLFVEFRVLDTSSSEEFCNCTLETVEPMFPGKNPCTLVINTKQAVKYPPLTPTEVPTSVVNFNFLDVTAYAKKVLNVLQSTGDLAIDVIKAGFALYSAFTTRDFSGLFAALNTAGSDIQKIVAAIKAEFQLE